MTLKTIVDILKYLFLLGFISTGYLVIVHPNKQLLWFLSVYLMYFFISSIFLSHALKNNIDRKEVMKSVVKILLGTLLVYLIYYNVSKAVVLMGLVNKMSTMNSTINGTNSSLILIGLRKKFNFRW